MTALYVRNYMSYYTLLFKNTPLNMMRYAANNSL